MSIRNCLVGLLSSAVFLSLPGCFSAGKQDSPTPVLVFGIDGATWKMLEPMIAAGELPNLARHYERGVRGVLRSRAPAISPVSWTTIFTGRLPSEHGIESWKTSQSSHRRVKALWNMATDAGRTTNVFNVPSTWPPEAVSGVMLSGFPLSGSHVGGNTGVVLSSSDLDNREISYVYRDNAVAIRTAMEGLTIGSWSEWFDVALKNRNGWTGRMKLRRLDEDSYYASPFYRTDDGIEISYPTALRNAVKEELGQDYIPEGPGWSKHAEPETPEYLLEHLVEVSRLQTGAAAMLADADWDLLVYVNTLVDRVSHPYWAYMRPQDYEGLDAAKAAKYRDAVRDAYLETDRQLGEILAGIDGDYYFVVASDHGFQSGRNKSQYIGTHEFDGVYIVSGPGLSGKDGPLMNIEDICPTVLYLMGLPFADDLAGKVPEEIVATLGHRPDRIASYETVERESSDLPVDEATWDQLRGLGYVDGAPPRRGQD